MLKSNDDAEHRAHAAVLSAASVFFKNLLSGSFLEADQVQRGQPVEISASKAAVSALLDYIYGGQPQVNLEAGLELLRLAEAYNLPKLASAIEAGFRASLDSNSALHILKEAHGLHTLKAACEERVAENFETCSQHPDFGKLSSGQLARILKREDLSVSREEAVLKGLFHWLKVSKDRYVLLAMLLQHVDFQSVSVDNLLRLGRITLSGPTGDDLQREVDEALRIRGQKRAQSSPDFQPKRRCLTHWSPDLGASTKAPGRAVLQVTCTSLCWHEGAIYATDYSGNILHWKPGDPAADMRRVVGEGVGVSGINLGSNCELAISATGEIFVGDSDNGRVVDFQNGSGRLVLDDFHGDLDVMCCSPNGVLYLLTDSLQKLLGSSFQTVITSECLTADSEFMPKAMFVTKEEVIYILDNHNARILRFNPAESFKTLVVGEVPEQGADLRDLFVTEAGTIYIADQGQRKVLAMRPGDATFTEVLECPDGLSPSAVLVQDKSLYVSTVTFAEGQTRGCLYEYVLPDELHLE